MNNSWNDELISAYLDGELTADEQVQVEQALASDARLRQMHDDMRALRQSLQALPQRKLGDHFTARIVLAAQQAQAAQQAPPTPVVPAPAPSPTAETADPAAATDTDHRPHHLAVVPAHPSEPTAWHVLVWSIAGMAAALLLVLLWPQPMADVAMSVRSGIDGTAADAEHAGRADSMRAFSQGEPEAATKAMEAPQAMKAMLPSEQPDSLPPPRDNAADAPAPPRELQRGKNFAAGSESLQATPAEPAAAGMQRNRFSDMKEEGGARGSANAPAALGDAASRSGSRGGRFTPAAPASPQAKMLNKSDAKPAEGLQDPVAAEELQIVRLDVPVEVLRQRQIDAKLAEHGIPLADATVTVIAGKKIEQLEQRSELRKKGAVEPAADSVAPLQQAQDAPVASALSAKDNVSAVTAGDLARIAEQATANEVDVMLIEAAPEKLAKVLAALQTQPGVTVTWSEQEAKQREELDKASGSSRASGIGGDGTGAGRLGAGGLGGGEAPPKPAIAAAEALAPQDAPAGAPPPPGPASAALAPKSAGSDITAQKRLATPPAAPLVRSADERAPTDDFAQRIPWQTFRSQAQQAGGVGGVAAAQSNGAVPAPSNLRIEDNAAKPQAGLPGEQREKAQDATFSAPAPAIANAEAFGGGAAATASAPKRVRVLLLIQATPAAAPSKPVPQK